ncbi:protein TOO MANY MOUTHS [Cinnamomum micranthum f. kanehirae]|uniref:Protein TOO MANY MOUTHS n=1 Tax=Cinnamomum micranthum f. kanehirae TaxID=337451 RepID=A0A443PZQ4_9MAGN|nr:protein TOO MANY MOUTHS [Cinnamomum micranthum f. kanehirae]
MWSSFLFFLLSLQALFLVPSFSTNAQHQPQHFEPMNINMDSSETETLFHIMETMSSDRKWRLSNPTPCKPGSSWPGLACKLGKDNHLHVSRLDFGTPPNPTCKKTAVFPSQIFNLPYLESVFFFNCFTHTKTAFSIPQQTAQKTSSPLQQLSLRSNQALVGSIPLKISSLKSLQILTLSQNHLHGKVPDEISTLTSLVHLDLSYNFLTGSIPDQIGKLKNLVGLDLSYNSLTGSIPESIGQMCLLQKLDLSSNSLTGNIPDSLQSLSSLVFMALSSNRLKGKFPAGMSMLQSLQYFIMDDNPMFMPLPAEIGRLVRLQELRLANSGYSGVIPESFSQLRNLSTLSLQNNNLTGEIPVGLKNLSHIYHLNLSRNMLGGVVPFDAGFLNRLGRNLDLSGNPGLCLNKSEGFIGTKIGVGVCGNNNRNGSFVLPLKKSGATPSAFCKLCNLVGYFLLWGLYQ